MKTFSQFIMSIIVGFFWNGLAQAEGGCPANMYPFQFAPNQPPSCAPIPGNQTQQTQQQPVPQWERRWGAIATSIPDGVLGTSIDKRSEREASQLAIRDCASKGGLNCKMETAYDNQCAAVIVGDGGFNAPNAATIDKAVELGMKTCSEAGRKNCHVYYSACSLPARVR